MSPGVVGNAGCCSAARVMQSLTVRVQGLCFLFRLCEGLFTGADTVSGLFVDIGVEPAFFDCNGGKDSEL